MLSRDEIENREFKCYECNSERDMEDAHYWSQRPCEYKETYLKTGKDCPTDVDRLEHTLPKLWQISKLRNCSCCELAKTCVNMNVYFMQESATCELRLPLNQTKLEQRIGELE